REMHSSVHVLSVDNLLHLCNSMENEVKAHSLPYMALLVTREPVCGGCGVIFLSQHQEVLLGVHSISKEENFRQKISVKKRVPHPSYDLDKPANKTKAVNWLPLGKTIKDPVARTRCVVAGWGKTASDSTEWSDVLMSTKVTVVDRKKCNSPDFYNHRPVITSDMVCAGGDGKNIGDTCQGDSGGPLLCNNALVGITSFGRKCGIIDKPGVYAFLSAKTLTWIKKTIK
uniref:Peptidase S1 domain-containing protein n=1 Tax=Gouania willdenowi TaxID=441366 RepID=A0A8C5H343_GOUWI